MSSNIKDDLNDDEDVVVPKMKAISKPKNLKKRKRDLDEPVEEEDPSKKSKSTETTDEDPAGASRLEEMKLLQQMRAARPKGSDMSSEHVQLSKAAIGGAEDQSIGSLTQNFTGQRAKVNTLDTRMDEFIEQEMAKRKAARAEGREVEELVGADTKLAEAEIPPEAQEEVEEEEASLKTGTKTAPSLSLLPPAGGPVIDLSNTVLRAMSSTQAAATSSSEPVKKWHRSDAPTTTTGILEVDLPMDEQVKMFEATRQAALDALRDQRKKKPKRSLDHGPGFDDFGDGTTGNLSSDFSKHKRYEATVGQKATDDQVYDRYKKKQASSFR